MIHRQLSSRCSLHARRLRSSGAVALPVQQRNQAASSRNSRSSSGGQQQQQGSVLGGGGLLTRDFIAKSLYNQDNGYFSTKDVINDLPGPLEFGSMMGELHYRMDVKQAYESKLSAWMTPVETFSPHYSYALARFIAIEAKKASVATASASGSSSARAPHSAGAALPRKIPRHQRRHKKGDAGGGREEESVVLYEAGGGTGTNALNVLDWLQREEPKLYERTEYTIIEISPRLAELQKERVCTVHENCRVVNANVLEWGISGEVDPRPCFFMGMELLDNLPHDKIAWVAPTYEKAHGENRATALSKPSSSSPPEDGERRSDRNEPQLCEAMVVPTHDGGGFREVFRPLQDPLIRELLAICPELATAVRNRKEPSSFSSSGAAESKSEPPSFLGRTLAELLGAIGGGGDALLQPEHCAAFVPTGSLRLVQALRERLPRHRAILADFDTFAGSAEARGGGASAGNPEEAGEEAGEEAAPAAPANDESLTAFQAPIVSSRNPASGSVTDYGTYMVPLGSADIFFPTCFERLSRLHAAVCNNRGGATSSGGSGGEVVRRRRGLVVKQGEFLKEFADLRPTRTFSGFNPLVDDFRNSSVFLSGAVVAH